MTGTLPDPDNLDVPDVETLEALRQHYGLSMNEFSRRAGYQRQRWNKILARGSDPGISVVNNFVEVLRDADPDGPRTQPGRRASCLADGGDSR